MENEENDIEVSVLAVSQGSSAKLQVVSWGWVKKATAQDQQLLQLMDQVSSGSPEKKSNLQENVTEYWEVKDSLSIMDGVLLLG